MKETWIRSLGQEDPLEEEMATRSSQEEMRNPVDRGAWRATAHDWEAKHACMHARWCTSGPKQLYFIHPGYSKTTLRGDFLCHHPHLQGRMQSRTLAEPEIKLRDLQFPHGPHQTCNTSENASDLLFKSSNRAWEDQWISNYFAATVSWASWNVSLPLVSWL